MPKADLSILTQLDCERADATIKDGRPRARLLTLGGGLCLQITPGKLREDGSYALSKSWLFSYSLDGKAHRIGLGPFDRLPLDRARVKALALQEQVEQKIDPLEQREQQRRERERQRDARKAGVKTFRQCAEAYMAVHKPAPLRAVRPNA
jgi:hypothetical protein